MDAPDFNFIDFLAPLLPVLGIAVTGLFICRNRLKEAHPRACKLATAGWVVVVLRAIVGQGVLSYLVLYGTQIGSAVAIASALTVINIVSYLLLIAALVLFMLAILADRGRREEPVRAA